MARLLEAQGKVDLMRFSFELIRRLLEVEESELTTVEKLEIGNIVKDWLSRIGG